MAETTLVDFPREAGWKLLESMDQVGLEITAAFWLYLPDEEAWRLVLAAPATQTDGAFLVARRIRTLLDLMQEDERDDLSLSEIAIVSPHLLMIDEMLQRYGPIVEDRGRRVRRSSLSRDEPFIYRLMPFKK